MYRIKLRTAVPFEYSIFAVAISRHRGAKQFQDLHPRNISLLSPAYLLFIVDIYSTQKYRFTMADLHPCLTHKSYNQVNFMPLHSKNNRYCYESTLCIPSLHFGRRPPQSNLYLSRYHYRYVYITKTRSLIIFIRV
jgi:hypothetical protein